MIAGVARLAVVLALVAGPAWTACQESRAEFRGPGGAASFGVEVADDGTERAVGLMNRKTLGASRGMLFVYEAPGRVSFWMENTLIPLDMIFMGADGVVQRVHENAVPLDRSAIPGGTDIQFVLEINGGFARRLGIGEGSQMRHPAVDPAKAAWPCE
jgi:uncharacterized membrane protein (UPF0127 family)